MLESKPDLYGNPVRTWLTTLSSRNLLCICRANQGEFTQPRHGVPRVGMGLDYFIVHTQLIEPNDRTTTRLVTLIELIFAHLPRVGRDIMTDFAHLPLEGREL